MHDLIIIGAGPSGLAAGMYAGRLGLKTLIIGDSIGGALATTTNIENYPGFKSISGEELINLLKEHALEYGVELIEELVESVEKKNGSFEIETEEGESFSSKALIFATGTKRRKLPAKNAELFENRGIYYCALCDGPLFKDKVVGVVGGSDSAAKEALILQQYARKVYIIYRGEKIHPEPPNLRRIEQSSKIEVINRANILEVAGRERLEKVILDREFNGRRELKLDAVFVAIGGLPRSELAESIGVATNEKGEIIIDREAKTNIPGVFACGDVVDTKFKQAIVGVGEAVVAAYSAYEYITKQEVKTHGKA